MDGEMKLIVVWNAASFLFVGALGVATVKTIGPVLVGAAAAHAAAERQAPKVNPVRPGSSPGTARDGCTPAPQATPN